MVLKKFSFFLDARYFSLLSDYFDLLTHYCAVSSPYFELVSSFRKKPSHVFTTSSRHFDSASHCFKKILIILVFCRRLSKNSHVDSLNKNDDLPCHYFAFWYRSFCRVSNSLFHYIIFQYSISFFWHSNLLIWLTTSSFEDIISSFWRRSYLTVPWSNELLSQNNDRGGVNSFFLSFLQIVCTVVLFRVCVFIFKKWERKDHLVMVFLL